MLVLILILGPNQLVDQVQQNPERKHALNFPSQITDVLISLSETKAWGKKKQRKASLSKIITLLFLMADQREEMVAVPHTCKSVSHMWDFRT